MGPYVVRPSPRSARALRSQAASPVQTHGLAPNSPTSNARFMAIHAPHISRFRLTVARWFDSWAGGLIHDYTHGYNALIAFALVNVILGMIPFLVMPALRR